MCRAHGNEEKVEVVSAIASWGQQRRTLGI